MKVGRCALSCFIIIQSICAWAVHLSLLYNGKVGVQRGMLWPSCHIYFTLILAYERLVYDVCCLGYNLPCGLHQGRPPQERVNVVL